MCVVMRRLVFKLASIGAIMAFSACQTTASLDVGLHQHVQVFVGNCNIFLRGPRQVATAAVATSRRLAEITARGAVDAASAAAALDVSSAASAGVGGCQMGISVTPWSAFEK